MPTSTATVTAPQSVPYPTNQSRSPATPLESHGPRMQGTRQVSLYEDEHGRFVQISPDGKRLRFGSAGEYIAVPSQPSPLTQHSFTSSPYRDNFAAQRELPQRIAHPNPGVMAPPLRLNSLKGKPQRSADLPLPPNQSGIQQNGSLEAIIMNMNWQKKLRAHSRISLPVKTRSFTRGCLIAVEGENEYIVADVFSWLDEQLRREPEYSVRGGPGPAIPAANSLPTLAGYLSVVMEWHKLSGAIMQYITSPCTEQAQQQAHPPAKKFAINDIISHEITSNPDSTLQVSQGLDDSRRPPTDSVTARAPMSRTPIFLLHHYQYRATNAWACRIPIQDNYAAVDHWQWFATMWRGIVAADLTIFIKDCSAEEIEKESGKTVELREDIKCLIVRRERRNDSLDESVLRRLAFEVQEYIRSPPKREMGKDAQTKSRLSSIQ